MIRPLLLIAAIVMSVGTAAPTWAERPVLQSTPWASIAKNPKFRLHGDGDLLSERGAALVVESDDAADGETGGAIARVDGQALQGRRVTLSARLATTANTRNAFVWIRADSGDKRKLGFINSTQYPVAAGEPAAERRVSLLVPADTVDLVFGVGLVGKGRVDAQELRLQVSEEPLVDAQATPRDVLDAAIAAAREHALHRDRVDWDALTARLRTESASAKTPAEVHPQIRSLLAALNDGHSLFLTADAALQHASTGAASEPPEVRLLDGGIGYVLVPGFSGRDEQAERAFSRGLADDIARLADQAPAGWIVDLRRNGGGNMWPMLAALKPLLGDGVVGQFRDGDGMTHSWRAGDRIDDPAPAATTDLSTTRVAVLIGGKTASSGEAVAVAFHGRPQTRSFGHATAGQASSNRSYPLPDGSQLFLTTSIDLDRNGVAFGTHVDPDQTADDGAATLAAATTWLSAQGTGAGAPLQGR